MKAIILIIALSIAVGGCKKIDDALMGNTFDSQSDIEQQLSSLND